MRRLTVFLIAALFALPALAAGGWTPFHNDKFGVRAMVPPGFIAAGVPGPEGQTFRSQQGLSELRIYGQVIPGKNFTAYVEKAMAFDHSYYGWTIMGKTITPTWAEYKGSHGRSQLRVRIITACNGRHALAVWFQYTGNMGSTVSKLLASLKAGKATSC